MEDLKKQLTFKDLEYRFLKDLENYGYVIIINNKVEHTKFNNIFFNMDIEYKPSLNPNLILLRISLNNVYIDLEFKRLDDLIDYLKSHKYEDKF